MFNRDVVGYKTIHSQEYYMQCGDNNQSYDESWYDYIYIYISIVEFYDLW